MNSTAVEIRHYSGEVERHQHAYHQVILPCAGSLEIEIEQNAGRVAGSVASFVPAGCGHTFLAQQADAFLVLDVPMGIGPEVMDHRVIPPFFAFGADVQGLIDYMIALGPQTRLSPSLAEAWSTLLLDRLSERTGHPDRAETAVRRATAFMKSKLADPIRVADIAQAAGMSPTRLHEAFVKRRTTTPHAQLMALRLDAAEQMLADPRLSIAEIALRTGHADQSALTRSMRRNRGITPAGFRRGLLHMARENA